MKNFLEKSLIILIVFFPISFALNFKLFKYYSFILLINTLINLHLNKQKIKLENIFWAYLPIFYFIHVIFLLNTKNLKAGFFDLEVKFSLLFLPILFFLSKNFFKKYFNTILKTSFLVPFTIFTIFLIRSLINYFCTSNINKFFYDELTYPYHPSYFAVFLTMGFLFFYNFTYDKKLKFKYLIITFYLLAIYLISSKANFLILPIVLFIIGIYEIKGRKYIGFIYLLLLLLTLSIFLFLFNKRIYYEKVLLKENLRLLTTNDKKLNEKAYASTTVRLVLLKLSKEIIKENFLFGVGTGDIKDVLLEKYKENGVKEALDRQLNLHNQFLETLIGQGIIGFAFLLFIFLFNFIKNLKTKNYIFLCLHIVFFINFMFESMLNTQAGVILYSYLCCLNFLNYEKRMEERRFHSFFTTKSG